VRWVLEITPNPRWVSSHVPKLITRTIKNQRNTPGTNGSLILIFSNTQWFFGSEIFSKCLELTVLYSGVFKIPGTGGYYKNKIPAPTLVLTDISMNRFNLFLSILAHDTPHPPPKSGCSTFQNTLPFCRGKVALGNLPSRYTRNFLLGAFTEMNNSHDAIDILIMFNIQEN
jgi:hypothetical protein